MVTAGEVLAALHGDGAVDRLHDFGRAGVAGDGDADGGPRQRLVERLVVRRARQALDVDFDRCEHVVELGHADTEAGRKDV